MIYMDTDPTDLLDGMADVLSASPYSTSELEDILWNEVLPACRFNMWALPAPEWAGFDLEWLSARILAKHRYGRRRRPLRLRGYTQDWWARLSPLIEARRNATPLE